MTQEEYIDILFRQCEITSQRDKDIFIGVAVRRDYDNVENGLKSLTLREKSTIIARLKDRKNQLQLNFHTDNLPAFTQLHPIK